MISKVFIVATVLITANGDLPVCLEALAYEISNLTTLFPTTPFQSMAAYSGKGINDLGDYDGCCGVEGAEYALFTASINGTIAALGLCGPEICTKEDYYEIIGNFSLTLPTSHPLHFFATNLAFLDSDPHLLGIHDKKSLGESPIPISVAFPQVYIQDYFRNLSIGAIFMLILCVFLVLVVSVGTFLDILQTRQKQVVTEDYELMAKSPSNVTAATANDLKSEQSLLVGLLLCFSVYTNFPKLFSSRSAEKVGQRKDTLDILNAVRVMSMGWVILGHIWVYRFLITVVKNPRQIRSDIENTKTAIIYGGYFSVDSFFWLSGCLFAFLLLQQLTSKPNFTLFAWAYLYSHRFYRILPAYMFILFLTWSFTKYIGDGPVWLRVDDINKNCHDYWWTNLFFVNNFIPTDSDGGGCIPQSWYLANDMQFFLISPPILVLYHRFSRGIGWVLVSSLCICAIICSCVLTKINDYNAVLVAPVNSENNFTAHLYMRPYCRVAPYALGIVCGLILYSYRNFKRSGEVYDKYALWMGKALDNPRMRYTCVGIGLLIINFLIFIQMDAYIDFAHGWTNWTQTDNILFIGFSRFFWGVGLSLVLLPMLLGYIPIATWFLSLSIWAPFARLTFCTYLIHLHLIFIYYLSQNTSYWFDDLNLVVDFVFITFISFSAAVPLTLMVESPFMALEKLMKGRNTKARDK